MLKWCSFVSQPLLVLWLFYKIVLSILVLLYERLVQTTAYSLQTNKKNESLIYKWVSLYSPTGAYIGQRFTFVTIKESIALETEDHLNTITRPHLELCTKANMATITIFLEVTTIFR